MTNGEIVEARRVAVDMCMSQDGNRVFVCRDGFWYELGSDNHVPVTLVLPSNVILTPERVVAEFPHPVRK